MNGDAETEAVRAGSPPHSKKGRHYRPRGSSGKLFFGESAIFRSTFSKTYERANASKWIGFPPAGRPLAPPAESVRALAKQRSWPPDAEEPHVDGAVDKNSKAWRTAARLADFAFLWIGFRGCAFRRFSRPALARLRSWPLRKAMLEGRHFKGGAALRKDAGDSGGG